MATCELKNACSIEVAHWLMQRGADVLAKASARGMPIDMPHVLSARKKLRTEADELERSTLAGEHGKSWCKTYGSKAGFSKNDQVEDVLFNHIGLARPDMEGDGEQSAGTKKDILEELEHPLAEAILRWRKLDKAEDFLEQIEREVVGGVLHPSYSLAIPHSYRSSSSNPNGQNYPARDEEIAEHVRRAFYAPKGWHIVERDFKGIEVAVAACYHQDPCMIKYLTDKTTDMHRDVAADCYILDTADVGKRVRYSGKNGFTFPEFYGSYWRHVAPSLWRNIRKLKLKRERDGVDLYKHLAAKGITELGDCSRGGTACVKGHTTFAEHISRVERKFWESRFRTYANWKREWYSLYCRRGWIPTLTGFTFRGHYRRNQVINLPVQGPAFHCMLRGFIRLDEELVKQRGRMRAYECGQIHDSILAMVPDEEFDDYNALAEEVTVKELMREWKWIVVPIEVETEASPSGGTWWEKEGVK